MTARAQVAGDLRAVVVVPARDEQERIGACIDALATQHGVPRGAYAVVLVLDACTDATEPRARAAAARHAGLTLETLEADGRGVGWARRLGMDHACRRLIAAGRPDGLIASTDADSVVAPDWLARQLAAADAGARAIGGRVEIDPVEARALTPGVLRQRRRSATARHDAVRARVRRVGGSAEHWQFSGASMAVTAETYLSVGGLEPAAALEDEALERALERHGVPIERRGDVRVTTSGRRDGRAGRGLARDLSVAQWRETKSFRGADFRLPDLLAAKREPISVVLPTREVAGTVGRVVRELVTLRRAGLVDEILVVDAASEDSTREVARAAGADVLLESDLLPDLGPGRGKGDAMYRALSAVRGEIVAYLDADTEGFDGAFLVGMLGPLLLGDPAIQLVKGRFRRPFTRDGMSVEDEGGRVTELVARPLINLFAPALAGMSQPLAGEIAARASLLRRLAFPVGYGIEIAMMLDSLRLVGIEAIAEVDLGTRQNRHQSLRALGVMAGEVMTAALRRTVGEGPVAAAAPGPYLIPGADGVDLRRLSVDERPPLGPLAEPGGHGLEHAGAVGGPGDGDAGRGRAGRDERVADEPHPPDDGGDLQVLGAVAHREAG